MKYQKPYPEPWNVVKDNKRRIAEYKVWKAYIQREKTLEEKLEESLEQSEWNLL